MTTDNSDLDLEKREICPWCSGKWWLGLWEPLCPMCQVRFDPNERYQRVLKEMEIIKGGKE